jgi:hypothetical protein
VVVLRLCCAFNRLQYLHELVNVSQFGFRDKVCRASSGRISPKLLIHDIPCYAPPLQNYFIVLDCHQNYPFTRALIPLDNQVVFMATAGFYLYVTWEVGGAASGGLLGEQVGFEAQMDGGGNLPRSPKPMHIECAVAGSRGSVSSSQSR